MDPIAEDLSAENESDDANDHLSSSILSFQHFLQDDPEPQEISDSHHSDGLDNENNSESDSESDDESIQEKLERLIPRKSPRKASRKKPGPKPLSCNKGLGKLGPNIPLPSADADDPRTCGA